MFWIMRDHTNEGGSGVSSSAGALDDLETTQSEESASSEWGDDESGEETSEASEATGTTTEEAPSLEDQLKAKDDEVAKLRKDFEETQRLMREQQSRADQLEHQLRPYAQQEAAKLKDRLSNEEWFRKRAEEVGVPTAIAEVAQAAFAQEQARQFDAMAAQQQAVNDNQQLAKMREAFTKAGKGDADLQQFLAVNNGFAGLPYATIDMVTATYLAGEHAHKVTSEAQEQMVRRAEEEARRKVANTQPRAGASPGKGPGTAKSGGDMALEGMAAAKAKMDTAGSLLD